MVGAIGDDVTSLLGCVCVDVTLDLSRNHQKLYGEATNFWASPREVQHHSHASARCDVILLTQQWFYFLFFFCCCSA